jgi:heme exporter protein C
MKSRIPITIVVAALMIFAGYAGLFIAPDEATMHEIQRIFYFHVAAWTAMTVALSVSCLGSIGWLATRKPQWDWLGVSGAEVGVVCCTLGLTLGVTWAKPAWGIWWTWDAKLTTAFILWLLYISYLLLRGLIDDPQRRATLAAVFGIFAYLDLPLVYVSNRLWRTQHPKPVLFGDADSGLDPTMLKVMLFAMFALCSLVVLVLIDRYRLERLRFEAEELRLEVESRAVDVAARKD